MTQIGIKHKDYPAELREIHQPPETLYIEGTLPSGPRIAMVGTRKPTPYGTEVAYRLAAELAQAGCVIVSGLAYGIDSIVHRAAVEAGGTTIAVMATGLDAVYPAKHRDLARQIVATGGALVTEYNEGTPPLKHHFPARNRIIAGLSLGTVVPEADARSGSLITAFLALDSNRIVMAVPGNITSERSAGPNNLLKAGAVPVTRADDIWTAVGLTPVEPAESNMPHRDGIEGGILQLIHSQSLDTESIAHQLEEPLPRILAALSLLELAGEIRNLGGGIWMRSGVGALTK